MRGMPDCGSTKPREREVHRVARSWRCGDFVILWVGAWDWDGEIVEVGAAGELRPMAMGIS